MRWPRAWLPGDLACADDTAHPSDVQPRVERFVRHLVFAPTWKTLGAFNLLLAPTLP